MEVAAVDKSPMTSRKISYMYALYKVVGVSPVYLYLSDGVDKLFIM